MSIDVTQLEGCIVWNDTIQYSPEAVSCPCTSCLLPAFDDALCHVPAIEWCQRYLPRYLFSVSNSVCFFQCIGHQPHQHCGVLLALIRKISDIGRCQNLGMYLSCAKHSAQRKDFELILTVTRRAAMYLGTHCNIGSKRAFPAVPPAYSTDDTTVHYTNYSSAASSLC